MSIKEEIQKIEGLAEAIRVEIEVWFEKYFGLHSTVTDLHQAKADLHETLGSTPLTQQ